MDMDMDSDALMSEVSEVEVPKVLISGGMTSIELKEFMEYVVGENPEPPEVMNKIMNNLVKKLSMGLGATVVGNMSRQTQISKYLAEAEKRIFDVDEIKDMPVEEVIKLYAQADKTLNSLQETQRKFIVQNKDLIKKEDSSAEKMVSKIMTLPPDKLERIMGIIDSEIKGDLKSQSDTKSEEESSVDLTEDDLVDDFE